jgi:O-antigen/teichoic acid export membrane protein
MPINIECLKYVFINAIYSNICSFICTMSVIKKLAGQTAIYGMSSMVARLLNYLLTPLYTAVFTTDQYGIVNYMYAYVGFVVVLLTYGMETAYFRFTTLENENQKKIYSTTLWSLFVSSGIFITLMIIFSNQVASFIGYPNNNEYIIWFVIIVGLDAISAIPLAKMRADNRPVKFALVNFVNIGVNIGLNLFFLMYCLPKYNAGETNWLIDTFYNPNLGVAYVFISNLIASVVKFLILIPYMRFAEGFDKALWNRLFKFAYPMLFVGLAGIVNEMIDRILIFRILFKQKLPSVGWQEAEIYANGQNGIYGANYKLAMILALFIQAFRFAAEPFFFSHEKEKDSKKSYVQVMDYFTIFTLMIFLGVTLYLDVFKLFIRNPEMWEGLHVVPIIMAAYYCMGLYVNQSIWYKLSQKTTYGAAITIFGAILTVAINVIFIPIYGYTASAWATLICYVVMLSISYFLGQKHYPIPYNLLKMFGYSALATIIFFLKADFEIDYSKSFSMPMSGYLRNSALFIAFIITVIIVEKPQKVLFSRSK